MNAITLHSIQKATDDAVSLWALSSGEYPKAHEPMITALVMNTLDIVSSFALNARRAMESLPNSSSFPLSSPRWIWEPEEGGVRVKTLWDATNRIIHARQLLVGLERCPDNLSNIEGESVFIPYIQAETDLMPLQFIDPFAMAHSYLYGAYPKLIELNEDLLGLE